MRTNPKPISLHHSIGDIKIQPSVDVNANIIKTLINLALDGYVEVLEEQNISSEVVHHDTKSRHGEYYQTPGYFLKLYRQRANLTQAVLAKKLNVKQHHLSEMENNKRSIGKKIAQQIAKNLHTDYKKFL